MVRKIIITMILIGVLLGCDLFHADVTGYLQYWTEYGESLKESESEKAPGSSEPVWYSITFIKEKMKQSATEGNEDYVKEIIKEFPKGEEVTLPTFEEFTNNTYCYADYNWYDESGFLFVKGALATQSKIYRYIPIEKVLDSSTQLKFSSYIISKGAS